MASLQQSVRRDQADGLRRLFTAPLPSLCTVLSAGSREGKSALMQRLVQNMAQRGRAVLVLEASAAVSADGCCTLSDIVRGAPAGTLAKALHHHVSESSRIVLGDASDDVLSTALREIAAGTFRLLVDADLDASGQLPLSVLSEGELVLQVDAEPASIREAYEIMRSLKSLSLPGTLSLLVTGASAAHARQVQANLFQAASRYLAMPVRTIVPPAVARHV